MPDHPHPASVTPSRSPAISESPPPGRPLRAAGQRSGARRCTPSPAANVESTRQGTRRLQRYISGTFARSPAGTRAGQVSPSRAARGAIATDDGAGTANPPTGRRGPGAARAGAKTAGWRMTPSSAFPADTGHTAPGASNRGSARHQRGRRSTRKPDLTAHVEPEHAAGTARPWPSVKQPTVRTDRPGARIPSAIRPWTPRHSAPQRDKVTHHGTEKNGPHSREFPASGPFPQVVAGVGFEPT